MVESMRAVAIILLLAALAYVLYLWSKRKDQIECPSCGNRVNMYKDECPHCGHEKGQPAANDTIETGTDDEAAAELAGANTTEELAESPDEAEDEDAADEPEPTADADEASETDEDADEPSGDLTCPECGKEFDSEKGLNIHKGMKH